MFGPTDCRIGGVFVSPYQRMRRCGKIGEECALTGLDFGEEELKRTRDVIFFFVKYKKTLVTP